jgi:hypothetical protein
MKKTILLLVLVAGAGYYLHWYTFTTETEGNTEHDHIVIDKEKIKQDEQKALEKLRGEGGKVLENAAQQTSYKAPLNEGPYSPNPYSETPPQYQPPRSGTGPAVGNQPAVQVVRQPELPQGYRPQGGYAPQQDPYSLPDAYTPPAEPRRPVRTAAQDLDRGFH